VIWLLLLNNVISCVNVVKEGREEKLLTCNNRLSRLVRLEKEAGNELSWLLLAHKIRRLE